MSAIDWMQILRDHVAASSRGQVAKDLGVCRAAVSLVLLGKYPAKTDKFAARVIDTYARIRCPFLEREITGAECRDFHTKDVPTSSPFAMRHWRACQSCPNRRPK